jgi:branched-chain amino acid transport system permease protein
MIVVGGVGSAKGAVIGTALLLYIDRTYADLDNPAWRFVWIGIIMFGITLLTTRGLVGVPGQIRAYVQRRRARQAGIEEPVPAPAELEVPGL